MNPLDALEVNGTFWHADPRVYAGRRLKPAQVKTLERYRRKAAALRELGMPIAEVWEADLERDARRAVRVALGDIQ
jgi:G:T-mismatch repair DNA endonuclease (very short patch repair protein)